jgi:predicted  nucleic acid-binding Zn-ribbon protein
VNASKWLAGRGTVMSTTTLEIRMESLEAQVAKLQNEIRELRTRKDKNWCRAIEKYAGDEDLQSIFAEAMKLREADRQRAREKRRNSRGKQG